MTRLIRISLLALVLAVAGTAGAGAVVPPQDCGNMTAKGKRYNIKADQLRCSTARSHARTYLERNRKPSGYTCKKYSGGTKLAFRCDRGTRIIYAIKR